MKQMYPSKINSPSTILSQTITSSDTSIVVDDVSVLPPAPSLATLGAGPQAETIRYIAIDSDTNTLTVERAFEGVANDWSVGTAIARNFTAYDHDAFKANIEENESNVAAHKADNMPHQFTDTTDSKTYRYGFKTNATKDGLVFVYEEVL